MLSFNDVSIVIRTVSTHRQEMLERLQNQLTPLNFVISDKFKNITQKYSADIDRHKEYYYPLKLL